MDLSMSHGPPDKESRLCRRGQNCNGPGRGNSARHRTPVRISGSRHVMFSPPRPETQQPFKIPVVFHNTEQNLVQAVRMDVADTMG